MERLECDRMFIAVFELGSFAKAAERRRTSPAQASRLISRLEHYLSVQLFKRTTRALFPTDVGKVYYEKIKILLEELDSLDTAILDNAIAPSGRLRLSAPISFGSTQLTPLLTQFAHQYPEINLDVHFSDRMVQLVDEGFDLAVRIGNLPDSSMISRKLYDSRILCLASPAYIAANGEPVTPHDLLNHRCVVDTNFKDPFNWLFNRIGNPYTVKITGHLSFSSAEACLVAVKSGLGITRVPDFVADAELRNGEVITVLQKEASTVGVYIIYPPARMLSGKVRALVDFLAEHYKHRL
ncbi:D-malate degradation protein R [Cedecea lapagei]|uniref:D-malate degradation protein R n=1 Tax=Cedecea lapagei TaxID=158823 RepID=A0A3S4JA21_9ENTR|nr:LysR family transcriptional regulator [Cedecea lapagei]VEB95963.1 D-malate degradation protein R [Cedecea lapagei]